MEPNEINFVLDKNLKSLNEEVEKLVYNINNPLAGKRIHLIKKFTEELMKAYYKTSQTKIKKHPVREAMVLTTSTDYNSDEFDLPIFENNQQLLESERTKIPGLKKQLPERLEIKRETGIKEIKPQPKKIFTPQEIPEERIDLITSKITNEKMAYAVKKGLFYIVNESDLNKDEIEILNFMKPSIEKNKSLFQDKDKFVKLMKKAARKSKIESDELSPSKLRYFLIKHIINFGLIDPLLYDPFITKITCDGPNLKIKIKRQGKEFITNLEFKLSLQLNEFIQFLAKKKGKVISDNNTQEHLEFENFNINVDLGVGENASSFVLERIV